MYMVCLLSAHLGKTCMIFYTFFHHINMETLVQVSETMLKFPFSLYRFHLDSFTPMIYMSILFTVCCKFLFLLVLRIQCQINQHLVVDFLFFSSPFCLKVYLRSKNRVFQSLLGVQGLSCSQLPPPPPKYNCVKT